MMALVLDLLLHRDRVSADAVNVLDRRLGVFRLHGSRIGMTTELFDLWSRCVPVLALPIAATGEVEFLALSALFDPVPEGEVPPIYAVRFSGGRADLVRL
ncbi:hypothetical protein [Azospirillum doebereinerae]|uniref:Uncharacterized protein n=1 Tax=Azospirillum doebereinerae TaxID=92933 RepID=A0A3S0V388_9PROT|nr:hypothetical protein [Azospirillum doebereinerae]RUQ64012.1 hypothetical protein EJ913_27205 [Azospirillum doebereinerae]